MNNMELVYRENVVFELYKHCLEKGVDAETFMIFKKAIENAKAVDAIPVIRCKLCKYASEFQPLTCLCTTTQTRMPLEGFCSMGMIKENAD